MSARVCKISIILVGFMVVVEPGSSVAEQKKEMTTKHQVSYDLSSGNPKAAQAAKERLVNDLETGTFDVARKAIKFCVGKKQTTFIRKALKHPRDDIKLIAAKSLADQTDLETAAVLIQALEDNRDIVEGEDEVMMRRDLKLELATVISKILGKTYVLDASNSTPKVQRLVQEMRKDLKAKEIASRQKTKSQ